MKYSKDFFYLQLQFARCVAGLAGISFEQALMDYTNFYVRFGLGREFNPDNAVWRFYIEGLQSAADECDWTCRFLLTRPQDVKPPSVAGNFGCFSYAVQPGGTIRMHFRNVERSARSPLSAECVPARLSELRLLFQEVKHCQPDVLNVTGTSWLYNLPVYRRLFPEAYLTTGRIGGPRFRNMPLWGQFLDRHGAVKPDIAASFLERLSNITNITEISLCFPLQPIAVEAPVTVFYEFYKV